MQKVLSWGLHRLRGTGVIKPKSSNPLAPNGF